jgi:hypothetical protein
MGALTSSIFSEIYLKYIENTDIYDILLNSKVEVYFRYVDNILVIYKENCTNIKDFLGAFNNIMPELKFTMEQEKDNRINYLDIKLSFDVFRKPITTDVIIPNDTCHPIEQKLAAIIYFANRIETYNLDHKIKQKETNTLKQIFQNNKYDATVLNKIRGNKQRQKQDNQNVKWVKFTYIWEGK